MYHDSVFSKVRDTDAANRLFSDALRTVRQHLDMPISYLSKFDGDDVVFLNVSSSLEAPFLTAGARSPAEGTYCKAVKDGLLPNLLPDTSRHPYARALPITSEAPVGAVVAIPIVLRDGSEYGMFCCLSHDPKPTLTEKDHAVMSAFAKLVTDVIEDRHYDLLIQDRLRKGIGEVITARNFDVVLQPIVDLKSGTVLSAESLCRFRSDPYRTPDKWFADAQACGMGEALELLVFRAAAAQIPKISTTVSVSINLSPDVVLSDGLMDTLPLVDTSRLVIEVTEHETFRDLDALSLRIAELRDQGVCVALDDLGAGYASLSAVLDLRPDIVKIDRKLIDRIHSDPASQSLTGAIVKFTADIGASLIAEGIERPEQVTALIDLGVTSGQGYFFARPDAVENLPVRIKTG